MGGEAGLARAGRGMEGKEGGARAAAGVGDQLSIWVPIAPAEDSRCFSVFPHEKCWIEYFHWKY